MSKNTEGDVKKCIAVSRCLTHFFSENFPPHELSLLLSISFRLRKLSLKRKIARQQKFLFLPKKHEFYGRKNCFALFSFELNQRVSAVAGNWETFQWAYRFFIVGTLLSNLIINSNHREVSRPDPQSIPEVTKGLLHHHPVLSFRAVHPSSWLFGDVFIFWSIDQ